LIRLGIFDYDNGNYENTKFDQIKEKLNFNLKIIDCEYLKGGKNFQMLRKLESAENLEEISILVQE